MKVFEDPDSGEWFGICKCGQTVSPRERHECVKESKWKVGERVVVYGYGPDMTARDSHGPILEIHDKTGWLRVGSAEHSIWAHPKQCRRLVKKPRRRVWISPGTLPNAGITYNAVLTNLPGMERDWIEFREVKRK